MTVSGDGLGAPDDVLIVVGLLIITGMVTAPLPQRIHVVGSVLAPRGSEPVLGPALAGSTGGIIYYQHADGQDFKTLSGQVKLSGAMLANPAGQPHDILIAAGQVVVTGQVTTMGYQQVIIAGQLAAPQASREAIEPRVLMHGQAAWYQGADARVFYEDTSLGPDFFRLLDHPERVTLAMAAAGEMTSAETATALGVPAGTVRYRLSLARRALAEALGHYEYSAEEQ